MAQQYKTLMFSVVEQWVPAFAGMTIWGKGWVKTLGR